MTPLQIVIVSFAFAVVSFSFVAWWLYMPGLKARPRHEALTRLTAIHTTRCAGLAFVVPGVTGQALDPRFADWAAYGDFLAALLALLALVALRWRWPIAVALVWIFNVEGALDIVNAIIRAVLYNSGGSWGGSWYIPIFAAPLLLVTHFMMFQLLVERPEA